MLLAQQAADDVFQGEVVRGREDVDPAVVVVVQRPAGEARRRPVDAQLAAHVLERAVAVVLVQPAFAREVVQEQVGKAVVVVVDPGAALAEFLHLFIDAGPGGDFLERAVAAIAIQPVGLPLAGDEQVDPAVVVVVGPGGRVGIDRVEQAGLLGDVGEAAVAVVPQQASAGRRAEPTRRGG